MSVLADLVRNHGMQLEDKWKDLYRLLEHRTEGEARKVVTGVKEENGFEAWRRLHKRFEAGMGSRIGGAMQDFTDMLRKPASSPLETPGLITELLDKMQKLEDISGKSIDDMHAKSILIGIMDPITKQMTSREHWKDIEELR